MESIQFYFDFVSPYAYLASNFVESLAKKHERPLHWVPFRLGVAVVKVMGIKPAMDTPLKNDYIRHDVLRMANVLGLPITLNLEMFDSVPAQRLIYGTALDHRQSLAKALLRARWADNLDLTDPAVLMDVAGKVGVDRDAAKLALDALETRLIVRDATDEAISRGVFGSPTLAVGRELFWGVDRMWLLDRYLEAGARYAFESGKSNVYCTSPNEPTNTTLKLATQPS